MTYELMVLLKLLNVTNHQNKPGDKLHLENREEIENRRGSNRTHQHRVTSPSFNGKTVPYNSYNLIVPYNSCMVLHVLADECDL
jgi:hypothetical protein